MNHHEIQRLFRTHARVERASIARGGPSTTLVVSPWGECCVTSWRPERDGPIDPKLWESFRAARKAGEEARRHTSPETPATKGKDTCVMSRSRM